MPRLLFFVPAEKAMTERDNSALSLITIMNGLQVERPAEGVDLPADAMLPVRWAVAAMWFREPGDEGKAFEQRVEVVLPDGSIGATAILPFALPRRTHHGTVRGDLFPVGQAGEYLFRLALREAGTDDEWQIITEYPFEVLHIDPRSETPVSDQP